MSLQNKNRQERMLRQTVIVTAWFIIVLGVSMAFAWLTQGMWQATLARGFFYMKFNTSLAFICGGVGLLAVLQGSKRTTLAAGSFVLFVGGVTLVEYLTGTNPGFDEWLLKDFHYVDNPYPGRMAPAPSLALTCAGIQLLLMACGNWQKSRHNAVKELLGFLVFALGAEGLIGHVAGIAQAYSWGSYAQMAPQAATGFMALGIGLLALAWYRQEIRIAHVPLWVPGLLCLLVLLFDLATPRGVAVGIVYVPLIFCGLWFTRPHATFVFATIASLLTVIAFFAKAPSNVETWMVVLNRVMTISMLWFVASLVYFHRKKQEAFRQSENTLSAVVDNVIDGLITINERGRISTFNPACERIFGYTAAEVIGQNIKMLMPEPYHSKHDGYLSHYVATGEAHIIGTSGREVAAKRKDGSVFPMDLSISAFELADGRHFSGIIRDITARKQAEQEIKDGAIRLKAVFDTVVDGLITINSHAIVQTFNASAERIFGYKAEEVIGENIKMLMPEPYHGEHDGYVGNYLKTGQAKIIGVGREVSAKRKDGSIFPMELGISAFTIGKETAFVGIIRDITARKEAETKLLRYTNALERSNKELDDFAYIASHDLKEPLRGLFNNAKFLEKDYKDKIDAGGVGRLQRLCYLTQRMEILVNDLLYFSRLGRQELAIQPTDLNAAIRDIESMMETTLKEKNATISIPHTLPEIVCDKTRVTEIFRNLISNAVKYNDQEKKIVEIGYMDEVRTKTGIAKNVFYVRDNGIGIEEEFYEEIFRIFKRLNEEDDDKKGTGVGLTFVRKIVDRHGGRIWLESKLGQGTTFYFTLTLGATYAAS
jgi:PAS domain S-box-containing protein